MRLLVIQMWTSDLEPIETALRAAGIDAAITRVDFQAALNAALAHERFDAVIFDSSTTDLSRETIHACLELNNHDVPLIDFEDVTTLGEQLLRVVAPLRN